MERPLSPDEIQAVARHVGITSIEALCNRAGINPSTFKRWKAGKHNMAHLHYIALLRALDLPLAEPDLNGATAPPPLRSPLFGE